MKKIFFTLSLIFFTVITITSQTAPSLSVIATPNSQVGWIYFKDPAIIDPNIVFTVSTSLEVTRR